MSIRICWDKVKKFELLETKDKTQLELLTKDYKGNEIKIEAADCKMRMDHKGVVIDKANDSFRCTIKYKQVDRENMDLEDLEKWFHREFLHNLKPTYLAEDVRHLKNQIWEIECQLNDILDNINRGKI